MNTDSTLGTLTVQALDKATEHAWDSFITSRPEANLYHTLMWRDFVQEVFGHQPAYLICRNGESITGVMPMFLVKMPLLGSKLISIPYDVGCGGALTADAPSEAALAAQAIRIAQREQVGYVELRSRARRPALHALGLTQSEPVILSEMQLDAADQVWARVSKDHRKDMRKAERRGITVREAATLEDFQQYYGVYLKVHRDFGTPPYGRSYFPTLWRRLHPSGAARLFLAYAQGRCVGGLLLFCWGNVLVSKFATCLPEAVPLRAYSAIYAHAIQFGLERGYGRLSWGTSSPRQQGLLAFKEKWGAESFPAVLYTLSVRKPVPSIAKYYDSDGLVRRLWRKLPLPVTQELGPVLNRWFC
jgi:predicted N-acyltransferase